MSESSPSSEHISVLAEEIARQVRLPTDGILVDATVGHGGHSRLLGRQLGPEGIILGLDVDHRCIQRAQTFLENLPCRTILIRENFARLDDVLEQQNIDRVDLLLADLGFCSAQLNDPDRGLSFQTNMPLDMRLDERCRETAADLVNTLDEQALADILYRYGEERASRKIAREIVAYRRQRRIATTAELAAVVCRAMRQPTVGYASRIHPATRTFQALRIAVNDELGCLERLLDAAPRRLTPGGIVAIISFHSLEDRIVKSDFKRNTSTGTYEILTPKPIVPSGAEMERNPRARSAKLRMARCLRV